MIKLINHDAETVWDLNRKVREEQRGENSILQRSRKETLFAKNVQSRNFIVSWPVKINICIALKKIEQKENSKIQFYPDKPLGSCINY